MEINYLIRKNYLMILIVSLGIFLLSSKLMYAFETKAKYAYVYDIDSNFVIYNKSGNKKMYPASMTKLMTAYVVFKAIRRGNFKLTDKGVVSDNAWRLGGAKSGSSTMFLKPQQEVSIDDLLKGVLIQSGNDACIVLAETIAGSEKEFAKLMNEEAKKLHLRNSHFVNSTGWPNKNHYTTPHDLVEISKAIIKEFPESIDKYFKVKTYKFNNINQDNRNPLLSSFKGATGMKTGHTDVSGYGIVGSVERNNRRIVAVLNGMNSSKGRSIEIKKILTWAYGTTENINLFKKGATVYSIPVILGEQESLDLKVNQDVIVTLLKSYKSHKINSFIRATVPVKAPIRKGQKVAELVIKNSNNILASYPLYAKNDIKPVLLLSRWIQMLKLKLGYNPYQVSNN